MTIQSLAELTAGYVSGVEVSADEVREAVDAAPHQVLIVLDDDPTGTQSVADLPVLTRWTEADLAWAFEQNAPAIYVMTNSRSLAPVDAEAINREVADAAFAAADARGISISFVSRSDSTLRGHYPLEPDTLADKVEAHGATVDGFVIVPAFGDAGRITVGSTHYAGSAAGGFKPVGETEFAEDATFGYTNSRLPEWIEEKTSGAVKAAQVLRLDLNVIRAGADAIAEVLLQANDRQPVVPDIVTEDDLRLLSLGLIKAEAQGKHFIYRVGPPFVRARIGQDISAPLTPARIEAARHSSTQGEFAEGGLIVVGSHVPTTTRQLNQLLERNNPAVVELDVRRVLSDGSEVYLAELVDTVTAKLAAGNVVFHTSRELVKGEDGDESLAIARAVSAVLVGTVNQVVHRVTPRFVIAKGGITSSDVASKGLEMTRAVVIGPMQPGIISLWTTQEGPATGVPYIVFAGNVGTDTSLAEVVDTLSASTSS